MLNRRTSNHSQLKQKNALATPEQGLSGRWHLFYKDISEKVRKDLSLFSNEQDFIKHVKDKFNMNVTLSKKANNKNGEKYINFQWEELNHIYRNQS